MQQKKREEKARKPAWVDESMAQKDVNIDNVARLRKLKKSEAEQMVKADEFAARLKT